MVLHLAVAVVTYQVVVRLAPPRRRHRARATGAAPGWGPLTPGAPRPLVASLGHCFWLATGRGVEFALGVATLVVVPTGRPTGWWPEQGRLVYLAHALVGPPPGHPGRPLTWSGSGTPPGLHRLSGWVGAVGVALAGRGRAAGRDPSRSGWWGWASCWSGPAAAGFGYLIPTFDRLSEDAPAGRRADRLRTAPSGRQAGKPSWPYRSRWARSDTGSRRGGPRGRAGQPRGTTAMGTTVSGRSSRCAQLGSEQRGQRGHGRSEADGVGGQQEVLGGGIDRGRQGGLEPEGPVPAHHHQDRRTLHARSRPPGPPPPGGPVGSRPSEWARPPRRQARRVSSATCWRTWSSRTTTNTHGCLFSALGAWVAARRHCSTSRSSTGRGSN